MEGGQGSDERAVLDLDDPKLEEKLVSELKAQGVFDQFRKDCLSDVDTKVGTFCQASSSEQKHSDCWGCRLQLVGLRVGVRLRHVGIMTKFALKRQNSCWQLILPWKM